MVQNGTLKTVKPGSSLTSKLKSLPLDLFNLILSIVLYLYSLPALVFQKALKVVSPRLLLILQMYNSGDKLLDPSAGALRNLEQVIQSRTLFTLYHSD